MSIFYSVDIVKRLRATPHGCDTTCVRCRAANEIEKLRNQISELKAELHNARQHEP